MDVNIKHGLQRWDTDGAWSVEMWYMDCRDGVEMGYGLY